MWSLLDNTTLFASSRLWSMQSSEPRLCKVGLEFWFLCGQELLRYEGESLRYGKEPSRYAKKPCRNGMEHGMERGKGSQTLRMPARPGEEMRPCLF